MAAYRFGLALCIVTLLLITTNELFAVATAPAVSAAIDLSQSHDFAAPDRITADATTALPGLCTVKEFHDLAATNGFIYDFESWPAAKDSLDTATYTFAFHLAEAGLTDQKITLASIGAFPPTHILGRQAVPTPASARGHVLIGLGNIGWSSMETHSFKFEKPVTAFACVYRSPRAFELNGTMYKGATENTFPISYTLTDGTVVNLGERGVPSGPLKADTNTFVGVIDHSGRGIVTIQIHVKGIGNGDQTIAMSDLAFITAPAPAVSPVISLRASHDFADPESIKSAPDSAVPGLATLDDFRFIVGTHRYVYDFTTWPVASSDLGGGSFEFPFDLKGKGDVGQKITVSAVDPHSPAKLTKQAIKNDDGSSATALSGVGTPSDSNCVEQTFKFDKPVWAFGATLSSPNDLNLAKTAANANDFPVSYTLSDGTVVNLGGQGLVGGTIPGGRKTFVGVIDTTDKGISSVTMRLQGTTTNQPLVINNIAFAMAGLPPGDWKMTMHDEFDGTALNPEYWVTGYRFAPVINHEMQGYVPENVIVANGVCTIKVEKRECVNTDQYGETSETQQYASGAITTYDKWAQAYGYFEARVKMSSGPGTWPAFWLLPDRGKSVTVLDRRVENGDKGFGFGSEIDIFEFMPWWRRTNGLFLSHVGTIWDYGKVTPTHPAPHAYGQYALANQGYGPGFYEYPNADSQFHTYGLYWAKDQLVYYIDSKPVFHVTDAKHIAAVPEYILLNCAMSRNDWGMGPRKKAPTLAEIDAGLPCSMDIDYVRVYSGTLEK
jgi:beta-glucanase (GH16 family)